MNTNEKYKAFLPFFELENIKEAQAKHIADDTANVIIITFFGKLEVVNKNPIITSIEGYWVDFCMRKDNHMTMTERLVKGDCIMSDDDDDDDGTGDNVLFNEGMSMYTDINDDMILACLVYGNA